MLAPFDRLRSVTVGPILGGLLGSDHSYVQKLVAELDAHNLREPVGK
jgi:hypothetical protein